MSMLALSSVGLTLSIAGTSKYGENVPSYEPVQAAESVSSYYSSISDSLTGTALLNALHELNSEKRKSTVGYAGMRQFAAKSDADPNGSGKIVGFYDNKLVGPKWDSGNTWNREHVWPNVRGGDSIENDAHMIRPASTSTNGDRGSKGYSMKSYDPGQFVPYYRGSASRIIFYAAIANTSLQLVESPLNYHGGTPANSMGCLSEMLKWNLEYLPSDTSFTGDNDLARRTEINRNNVIQTDSSGQGNRNPFIDHPEYACRIWGNTNEETKKVCGATPVTPDPIPVEKMTISDTSKTMVVGETYQLSITMTPSNADEIPEITWSSTDESVATVDDTGLITALSAGYAFIEFKSEDNKFSASCLLTVEAAYDEDALRNMKLDVHEKEVEVGDTFDLKIILEPENPSDEVPDVIWSSSNVEIAGVNQEGKVFTRKEGEVNISFKSSDDRFSDTCKVTIKAKEVPVTPPSPTKNGCGGNVITTSVILSTISLLGISLILINKFVQKKADIDE